MASNHNGNASLEPLFGVDSEGAKIGAANSSNDANAIMFPKLSFADQISLDIGGSLTKVVWFSRGGGGPNSGGRLNFRRFETESIHECLDFVDTLLDSVDVDEPSQSNNKDVASQKIPRNLRTILATGGGAFKYKELIERRLNVIVQSEDEMECLLTGLNFLLKEIPDECFSYDEARAGEPVVFEQISSQLYPYMLVNIGSGVSLLKVSGEDQFERISGTSVGGGTLWGLLSLLTPAQTYDDMLELSKLGDNKGVDMLVGDIYGSDYSRVGLKVTTIASSFGKVFKKPAEERRSTKPEDICQSLLYMISNNIGQIAYLNAQLHGIERIFFGGSFIRGHSPTMNTLSFAVNFWSRGKMRAFFLRHEGYLGAVGAFLKHTPKRLRSGSFYENFTLADRKTAASLSAVGTLDVAPTPLVSFPLLADGSLYQPDTMELPSNPRLTQEWINILEKNLHQLVEMALTWSNSASDNTKAELFESTYRNHLARLREEPHAYGTPSVRSFLILREMTLHEMGFFDIYEHVKRSENEAALEAYDMVVKKTDQISDETERLTELIENVAAGNMFDWGSTQIIEMLKQGDLNFDSAKLKVKRSAKWWQASGLVDRLLNEPAPKRVLMFVDNSGADILLGVLPFIRALLRKGSEVILAANTYPAVNDVTVSELHEILTSVGSKDAIVFDAYQSGRLRAMGNGSGSPCLDLRRVDRELAVEASKADFVIIEGMGRAIHTNLFVEFSVESLKIAVFKNKSIADYVGAEC
ncbi:fumble-domain-containing protein [Gonapodya prolifera JEL478]|uniref:pantothenate kinase n=1 Tax=Gonapodya prolifera (strain JEL478) TaxID=1344416 RepID=A0A139A616_GONPJ|nr:fumble-domain-containing protein [Gonapodya prolifera JEL478]|eukprot:KXS12164.1 fumble-domain-containing protein [Gonapodya prolifera JEL478]